MNLRNPIRILSLNLLVVSLGYGLVLPIMPFYIESHEQGNGVPHHSKAQNRFAADPIGQ